jgi:hypothetical protein
LVVRVLIVDDGCQPDKGRSFVVDVVVKGDNAPLLEERIWIESDEPGAPLRIVKRECV